MLEVLESGVQMTSTDRYRVHRMRQTAKTEGAGTFIIPRPVLAWVVKNANTFGARTLVGTGRIRFDMQPAAEGSVDSTAAHPAPAGTVTVTVYADESPVASRVTYFGGLTKGNFPPVARLIDQARAAVQTSGPIRIRPDFLGATAHLAPHREVTPDLIWTVSENPNKPGPLLVQYEPDAEALIQPALRIR
jgi:hypothetical protein